LYFFLPGEVIALITGAKRSRPGKGNKPSSKRKKWTMTLPPIESWKFTGFALSKMKVLYGFLDMAPILQQQCGFNAHYYYKEGVGGLKKIAEMLKTQVPVEISEGAIRVPAPWIKFDLY